MANHRVIPTSIEGALLERRQTEGATLDELTAWLAAQGIEASRESVRRLLLRLSEPDTSEDLEDEADEPASEPAEPAEQIKALVWEVACEIKRARRATRRDPQQWRRLHSALMLKLRVAQVQQGTQAGAGTDTAWSPPTFGVCSEKGQE